jgi:hypothetical protein
MDKELEARELFALAEKKLRPGCCEAMCSSREERLTQAKEYFERAGNIFKLVKKWFEAGECFEKCAKIEEQLKYNATTFFEEATYCFNMDNTDKKSN